MPTLPPITSLPTSSPSQRAQILDLLFEPSTQLHTLSLPLLHDTPFPSYDALISAVGAQLTALAESASTSDTRWLESILCSHPRLGAKSVESAQSRGEQAGLGLQGEGEREREELRELNEAYEARFPGLRYVVFVNGRGRGVIMSDMRRRIEEGDVGEERRAAIRAMCEIAADRAKKLLRQE
ncbi:hypothetical protein LTR35_000741 [Friedmanniomyces endolithicus]|uniref:Oxo-4-hydroxy-4-carboxy-5-ureidoimidazoline decarboxylase domain-containing protein n=1 Tax=Friedmanniomyces endolithicus TaxID=329885 RepID=A0AAN6JG74_9PEZI|nr:hypothetical protein LTS00_012548 [Friedmanniomyces endolithicus]KAK0292710.1 hypothetical protein LTR35_000741 [Friedmanniomyces endolithicus]KAK0323222.1 hypothetical protein LTR82_005582 [Friedmanniomyces endolithicus]KAK1007549.1 hypothetical protein LTR54_006275 [Friedmanniomyces endolithicus]